MGTRLRQPSRADPVPRVALGARFEGSGRGSQIPLPGDRRRPHRLSRWSQSAQQLVRRRRRCPCTCRTATAVAAASIVAAGRCSRARFFQLSPPARRRAPLRLSIQEAVAQWKVGCLVSPAAGRQRDSVAQRARRRRASPSASRQPRAPSDCENASKRWHIG